MKLLFTSLVSFAGAVLLACSGDSDSVSISSETACTDVATALCEKIASCAPFLETLAYPDRATCIARNKINCVTSFGAPGTSASPTRAAQCARDAKTASCDDILGGTPPETCRTQSGTLDDGAVCGHGAQCKNKLCRLAAGSTCGACSSLGAAGAACAKDDECDVGLTCNSNKCVARGRSGGACSDTQPCVASLACIGGTCVAPLAAGATCSFKIGENPCEAVRGYYCHPSSQVCTAIGTTTAGNTCELNIDRVTVCSGGAECKTSGGKNEGTCVAPAADGAACDDTNGPRCVAPARCSGGVCTITDPASCK